MMNGRNGLQVTRFLLSIFRPNALILRMPWMHDHWFPARKDGQNHFASFDMMGSPFEMSLDLNTLALYPTSTGSSFMVRS
jgi:hypothetical protein